MSGGSDVQNAVQVGAESALVAAPLDELDKATFLQQMQMALDGSN
jgi:hypothetical protein